MLKFRGYEIPKHATILISLNSLSLLIFSYLLLFTITSNPLGDIIIIVGNAALINLGFEEIVNWNQWRKHK